MPHVAKTEPLWVTSLVQKVEKLDYSWISPFRGYQVKTRLRFSVVFHKWLTGRGAPIMSLNTEVTKSASVRVMSDTTE